MIVISDPREPEAAIPGQAIPEAYTSFRILHVNPLITISATTPQTPAGLASVAADIVGDRPALHLLHPSWTMESGAARAAIDAVQAASLLMPKSEFLLLASNDQEILAFDSLGGRSIMGNGLIMTDERIWYPEPVDARAPRYDAVYNARLDDWKRHELAASIDRLLLVYNPTVEAKLDEAVGRIRKLLPRAIFANHDFTGGDYRPFDPSRVRGLLGQSQVGLCLSAVEGIMRASMEYLLSGLPVVSTKSIGGRDRYFGTSYCRIVSTDDPDAISRAVGELSALNLDRSRIRDHVGQVLAFERYNFLATLNALIRRQFGLGHDLFPTMTPFLGSVAKFYSVTELRRTLTAALEQTTT